MADFPLLEACNIFVSPDTLAVLSKCLSSSGKSVHNSHTYVYNRLHLLCNFLKCSPATGGLLLQCSCLKTTKIIVPVIATVSVEITRSRFYSLGLSQVPGISSLPLVHSLHLHQLLFVAFPIGFPHSLHSPVISFYCYISFYCFSDLTS